MSVLQQEDDSYLLGLPEPHDRIVRFIERPVWGPKPLIDRRLLLKVGSEMGREAVPREQYRRLLKAGLRRRNADGLPVLGPSRRRLLQEYDKILWGLDRDPFACAWMDMVSLDPEDEDCPRLDPETETSERNGSCDTHRPVSEDLAAYGVRVPVVIRWSDFLVLEGHERLAAARNAGRKVFLALHLPLHPHGNVRERASILAAFRVAGGRTVDVPRMRDADAKCRRA